MGRFMSFKTFFRLLLAAGLLGGYYLVPRFLAAEVGEIGFRPGAVTRIDVRTENEAWVQMQRRGPGDWRIENLRGVRAAPGVVGKFLSALGEARVSRLEGVAPDGHEPEIVFSDHWRTFQTIRLGPRLDPFRRQVIFIDGDAYEIQADLSAILGFWEGIPDPRLEDRVPLRMEGEEVVALRWENPFATYDLQRGESIRVLRDEGRTTTLFAWEEIGSHAGVAVSSMMLSQIVESLESVVAVRLAAREEIIPAPEVYSTLTIETESGKRRVVGVALPDRWDEVQLLKTLEPEESEWWVVKTFVGRRVAPSGGLLFEKGLALETVAEWARRIVYERGGKEVVLTRKGTAWQMMRPRVPLEIFRPTPSMGDMHPMTMAEEYVERLKRIRLNERFVPDTEARKKLVAGVFDRPRGRVVLETSEGEKTEILISASVAETGRVFISVNGVVGVISENAARGLTPEVGRFFEKEAYGRLPITW